MNFCKTTGKKWKVWTYICVLCVAGSALADPATGASSLIINADAQYEFALRLFNQEAYSESIPEFERFSHFFPDDPRNPQAMIYIGRAYFHSERYSRAIKTFQNLIDRYDGHPESFRAFFQISDCYLKLKQPQQAFINLQNLLTLIDDPELKDKIYYRMGWIAVEAGVWQEAAGVFNQVGPQFRKEKNIDELLQALTAAKDIPLKNPKLAGTLSILPGAGQLYCRRYKDAMSAFIVNAGLILAAAESFKNELYALGATISFIEFGFYAGNIHGAVAGAHKYNQRETSRRGRKLREQYRIGLLPVPHNDGIMLSFQYLY